MHLKSFSQIILVAFTIIWTTKSGKRTDDWQSRLISFTYVFCFVFLESAFRPRCLELNGFWRSFRVFFRPLLLQTSLTFSFCVASQLSTKCRLLFSLSAKINCSRVISTKQWSFFRTLLHESQFQVKQSQIQSKSNILQNDYFFKKKSFFKTKQNKNYWIVWILFSFWFFFAITLIVFFSIVWIMSFKICGQNYARSNHWCCS